MPNTVRSVLDKNDTSLSSAKKKFLGNAFRPDGSSIPPSEHHSPILDQNPLREERRFLDYGDDAAIASLMMEINVIAERNRKDLLFLVPPVYETARKRNADDIFVQALRRVPELRVFDDRHYGRGRPELFFRYDHPNLEYYKDAVASMRAIGFLN